MSFDNQNKRPVLRLGILFLVLIVISVAVPVIGIVISIALAAGAVLYFVKVLPKPTGGIIAGTDIEKRKTLTILAVGDILMFLFLLMLSIAQMQIQKEKKAEAAKVAEQKRIETEEQKKETKAFVAKLTAESNQVADEVSRLGEKASSEISSKNYVGAKKTLTEADSLLGPYRTHSLIEGGLKQAAQKIRDLMSTAGGKIRTIELEKNAQQKYDEAKGLISEKKFVDADNKLKQAQKDWEAIDQSNIDIVENKKLGEQISKLVSKIEKKVAQQKKDLERQFRLGDFYYWIEDVQYKKCIRNIIINECAGENGVFAIVPYYMENLGKETETVINVDFKLVDSEGRKFEVSSKASTALAMTGKGDLAITELQPGVQQKGFAAFEIPKNATGLKLIVPEKGLLSTGKKSIDL